MKPTLTESYSNRVGFALGTGRCGTTFLSEVIALEPTVASSHCRHPLAETFHRYCRWNELPVDEEGFLQEMATGIEVDLQTKSFSFESSGYLSLSVYSLQERFDARFVLLIRNPAGVVNSHVMKGWYKKPVTQANPKLALGYQDEAQFHHFLGRIVPRGSEFTRWSALTQIGKLSWYWSALNKSVLSQFEQLPKDSWRVQKLEDLDYQAYRDLARFMGFESTVTEKQFFDLRNERPNSLNKRLTVANWSDRERAEFESQVSELALEFGYEFHIDRLTEFVVDAGKNDADSDRDSSRGLLGRLTRGARRRK